MGSTIRHLDGANAIEAVADRFAASLTEEDRQIRGAVHTPLPIAEFIVVESIAQWAALKGSVDIRQCRSALAGGHLSAGAADLLAKFAPSLRVLDPAVGAGVFLRAVATTLSAVLRRAVGLGCEVDPRLLTVAGVLDTCCRGYDVDPRAVRVARQVLGAEEDKHALSDSLVTVRDALLHGMRDAVFAPEGWDLIVMNPPYVGAKFTRGRLGDDLTDLLAHRHGFRGDLLAHFLAEAASGLRSGGVLGAIVSDTFFATESLQPARALLFAQTTLLTAAWCRPFKSVAVRGGIAILAKGDHDVPFWWTRSNNGNLSVAELRKAPRAAFEVLPSGTLFVPSESAVSAVMLWRRVSPLEQTWSLANSRNSASKRAHRDNLQPGDWTLLGIATEGGQGLATGDDREFVGFIDGTRSAADAQKRVARISSGLLDLPRADEAGRRFRALQASGLSDEAALAALNRLGVAEPALSVPGKKPFKVVPEHLVRSTPLSDRERKQGIAGEAVWVCYEMGDSSGDSRVAARWRRKPETVIDWSEASVALLRKRVANGPRKPFWRNESLWFSEGVTHNRVTSLLRARLLPRTSMFSSESPIYVPRVQWLDTHGLLALLNSQAMAYLVHTFLATRNHVEVGHVRRLPIPVLDHGQSRQLSSLGAAAATAATTEADELRLCIDDLVATIFGWQPPAGWAANAA